jgi:hypothetical protein
MTNGQGQEILSRRVSQIDAISVDIIAWFGTGDGIINISAMVLLEVLILTP